MLGFSFRVHPANNQTNSGLSDNCRMSFANAVSQMTSERFDVAVRHFLPCPIRYSCFAKAREAYGVSLALVDADAQHSDAWLYWAPTKQPLHAQPKSEEATNGPEEDLAVEKIDLNDEKSECPNETFEAFLLDVSFPETVHRQKADISAWQLRSNETQCVINVWHASALKPRYVEAFFQQVASLFELKRVKTYALAMSGGGLRATLFHLGLVRMLHDGKMLNQISHIVAISGGSILASHMALNWDKYSGNTKDFEKAAAEVIKFAQFNVRGRIIIKVAFYTIFRLGVWIWLVSRWVVRRLRVGAKEIDRNCGTWWGSPTFWLSYFYDKKLFGSGNALNPILGRMEAEPQVCFPKPQAPKVTLLATGMKSGTLCSFTSEGLQIESTSDLDSDHTLQASTYPLSLATAASSAFPVFFPPLKISSDILRCPAQDEHLDEEFLSDGGVFDNSGIRKLAWMLSKHAPHRCFDAAIASDAGAPFKVEHSKKYHSLWRLLVRAPEVLMRRVADLEDENTGRGTVYKDVPLIKANIAQNLKANTGLCIHPVLQRHLASIRTDLDGFDVLEIRALVKHGYSVGRAQLLRYFHDNKTQVDKTTVFAFRRHTTRSWDPILPKGSNRIVGKRSSMNLTKRSAAAYIGELDISKSRVWLRWSLFRQWELSTISIGLLIVICIIAMMHSSETKKSADLFVASDLDIKFKKNVVTATRAAISETENLKTQYPSGDSNKITVLSEQYGGLKSEYSTLSESFGKALTKNFQETITDLKRQLDEKNDTTGELTVRYFEKEIIEQRLNAAPVRFDVLKKERVLLSAGKSLKGSVELTIGRIRGGTRQAFIGNVVSTVIDDVSGPKMQFAGLQALDRPSVANLMFVQTPPLHEQIETNRPFRNPDFFTLALTYDESANSLQGEFIDPNVNLAIGKLSISWSR